MLLQEPPVRQQVNMVWFKRDLRFTDHEPLYSAQQQICLYCWCTFMSHR